MIARIIQTAVQQRILVLLLSLVLAVAGVQAIRHVTVDAIPDLSDVQVIIKTAYPGQSPELVEQQITYPLSRALMAVPGANTVRGYSFFGDSYIYVIFADGTDMYWARSRVLEYLSQAQKDLPNGVQPALGPDASGVGWVYQYALVDRSGTQDLADLKSLQDWYLKPELQAVAGVSEVATVGGMTRTYQIVLDPLKLAQYQLDISHIRRAVQAANAETGGSVLEQGEMELMIRARGYLATLDDFRQIPLGRTNAGHIPLLLKDVATIRTGPALRRGIAELDGEGEVTGGIIVMRSGENARNVIQAVRERLQELQTGLPDGVEIITTYDRSDFIQRTIDNLSDKLLEEMAFVAIVLVLFLLHLRSALVAIVVLPLAILSALVVMWALEISANIMSLGGIAIAIGALVDAAIVMLENQHKHLEAFEQQHGHQPDTRQRWQLVIESCSEVGPALFWSLMLITVSFFPVFALSGQEGRLFGPLALTKSLAMAAAALLAITLVPVLMGYGVRGKIISESRNPLSRVLIAAYRPLLRGVLKVPVLTLLVAILLAASSAYPLMRLGSEFMPTIDEGTLLYMPTTLPSVSAGKAAQILQQTDRLIKTVPEVAQVFGKVGRAETATDPAPLTMLETTILLKPREQWRSGKTLDDVIAELDSTVRLPGLTNAWVQPIKTRIDMLSTGIKTPLGLKIAGDDVAVIEQIGQQIEQRLSALSLTRSVFAERTAAGRYLDIQPDLNALARYGLSVDDLHEVVRYAIGGQQISTLVAGTERYPINLRLPRHWRDTLQDLRDLPVSGANGVYIPLSAVATLSIKDGPAMLKSENARLNGWVFIEHQANSAGEYIAAAKQALADMPLPPRYTLSWSGQYEAMQRVSERLLQIVPMTLLLCLVLLYASLQRWSQAITVMFTLPLALAASLWLLWLLEFNLSVAVAVGMIALAGVAAEFGVVMYLYLNQAWQQCADKSEAGLRAAVLQGAVQRIRPKAMTVLTIIASLLPLLFSQGAGHEVMARIAAPMLGGMLFAPLISLFVIPVVFYWSERRKLR